MGTLTGTQETVKEEHLEEAQVESSWSLDSNDIKPHVHVSSSEVSDTPYGLHDLYLTVWTMGLWHSLRAGVLSQSVGGMGKPEKIEQMNTNKFGSNIQNEQISKKQL